MEHNHQLSWPPKQEKALQDMPHENSLVKAVPAVVENTSDTEMHLSYQSECVSLPGSIEDRSNILDISSDSDLSIERVYNPQSGRIIEKFGSVRKPFKEKHESLQSNEEISRIDENHNDVNTISHENGYESMKSSVSTPCIYSSIKSPNDVTYETSIPTKTSQNIQKDLVPLSIQKNAEIKECSIQKPAANKETAPRPAVRRLIPTKNTDNKKIPHEFVGSKESVNSSQVFSEDEIIMDSPSPDTSLEPLPPRIPSSFDTDSEILDLEGKHLVKHILREMSRSYPNLTKLPKMKGEDHNQSTPTIQLDSEEVRLLPSVQDLKKKFEESSKVNLKLYTIKFSVTKHDLEVPIFFTY